MLRHEIQVLREAGVEQSVVARRTATSVRSVRRISKEPGVELLRRAQEAGYQGGKSALYELIRRVPPGTRGADGALRGQRENSANTTSARSTSATARGASRG